MIKCESYGISDIGLVRPNNEDCYLAMGRYHFFALADGMGGHKAGEVASKEALDSLKASIKEIIHPQKKAKIPSQDLIYHFRSAIENANNKVYKMSLDKEEFRGMGTTLCCLYIYEDSMIYAHVGDSRIYRYRERELKLLTEDHSLLTECKQNPRTYKHVLTRAIGTHVNSEPDIASATLQKDDIFFMCSDGLSDLVTLHEMEAVLQEEKSLKKTASKLVEMAKVKGSHDNITILFLRIK